MMSLEKQNPEDSEEYKALVQKTGKCTVCGNAFKLKQIKGEWKPYDRIWYSHTREFRCEKCGKCADCGDPFPIEERKGKWKVYDRYWYSRHREYLCGACHSNQERCD